MYFPMFPMDLPSGRFEKEFHVYPVSFIDKAHLENGDKVIMPPSALDRLASLHIDYPMLFEVHNPSSGKTTHCGVLEFVAEEGYVYMPYWMMQNLLLQEGDIVRFRNATLLKGTYVKLQPHTKDFLDISNPKAVLERTLRSFSCLTSGESVMVAYNNKKYYIDVVETKPSSAISIIETDCEVDFAPPLDYVEPERPVQATAPKQILGKEKRRKKKEGEKEKEEKEKEVVPSFTPFVGSGKRLDGRTPSASTASPSSTPNSLAAKAVGASATATGTAKASSSSSAAAAGSANGSAAVQAGGSGAKDGDGNKRRTGRLVFGGKSSGAASEPAKAGKTPEEKGAREKEEEKTKFEAFKGMSYTLK